ncbi:hypothetical protein [Clostridium grantii]|uniref:Uncharacterized protein n=1 Tax=Clostridium grantii DSM 8605 TaxID=1121316 RepID=A0A1M5WR46_9CLOT|nr:hypothetical protein [Clostridium grantii]SHH90095.1 hypothetical protein SAMN02745207_03080 [Clostridium grantii DSM 8605]
MNIEFIYEGISKKLIDREISKMESCEVIGIAINTKHYLKEKLVKYD